MNWLGSGGQVRAPLRRIGIVLRWILRCLGIRGQRQKELANGWQLLMEGLPGLLIMDGTSGLRWSSYLTCGIVSHRLCKTRAGVTAKLQPFWWRKLVRRHVRPRFVNGKLLPLRLVAIEDG